LLSFGQSHPWSVLRVRELMKFKNDGHYDRILRREQPAPAAPSEPAAPNQAAGGASGLLSSLPSKDIFKNPFKK